MRPPISKLKIGLIATLFLFGAVFGLYSLHYLRLFSPDSIGQVIPDRALRRSAANFTSAYHDLFFLLHFLPGAVYLLVAPILFYQHQTRRPYSALAIRVVLFCGFLILLWPIRFLADVHLDVDVSFFVIVAIELMWIWSLWLAVAAHLRGDRTEFIRALYYHYCLSIGAGFYRMIYKSIVAIEGGTAYLDRETLNMAYHSAWFIALALGTGLMKLFIQDLKKTDPK